MTDSVQDAVDQLRDATVDRMKSGTSEPTDSKIVLPKDVRDPK